MSKIVYVFDDTFWCDLINQSIQSILIFDILTNLILLLVVCLQPYCSMSDRLNFYFKQNKYLLNLSLDCFLTCSIFNVNCSITINDFPAWSNCAAIVDRDASDFSCTQTFFYYSLFNVDLQYLQYQKLSYNNINPNLYTNTNRRSLQWKVNYFFKKYIMLLDDIKLVNN